MCGETGTYRCYPECTLLNSAGGFFGRLLRSPADEPDFHKIIIRTIQLCQNATNQQTNPTCGNVKDLTPSGTLQKVGYSEFTGECPACVDGARAAATAVQEACLQTVYVNRTKNPVLDCH
jgi:hypothetical protein